MATNSVAAAFKVLEMVAELQPVGLSEVSRAVELPKSTVQRCLLTLSELGWVHPAQSPTRWSLTPRAFSVGSKATGPHDVRETAMPFLSELQLLTTETIHLCVPDGREMVLIERLDTPHTLRAFLPLGHRVPMHASATGQAYLAAGPDEAVENYIAGGLPRLTPATITSASALRAVIDEIRVRGYSINDRGLSAGIAAIGAAIPGPAGHPLGAVSVSGPASRITAETYEPYGAAAQGTAARIGAAL